VSFICISPFCKNSNIHTLEIILLFFRIIVVAMSIIHFSVLDNVKMTAKHISTKVSFKITIRERHVYIDIPCP